MRAKLSQMGSSLAILLDRRVQEELDLQSGGEVEVEIDRDQDALIVRPNREDEDEHNPVVVAFERVLEDARKT
jgi:antitoxin component of MazEF toxin-antitoxin module